MKRIFLLTICAALASAQNITRFAGIYNALDYAYGVPGSSPGGLKVSVGNVATGAQTITLDFGYTTLSDGTKIYPFSTNAPITVGSERVTPSSITCLSPNVYSTCQIRATFTLLHGPGDNVASATYGLQEAINAAHTLGGAVVVDGKWATAGGTNGMISGAALFGNTAIADNRAGQVFGGGGGGTGLSPPGSNNVIVKYTSGLATTQALFADFAALFTGTPSSATFARGDGAWATPPGTGDVVGPGSSVNGNVTLFSGTTGKLLSDSGLLATNLVTLAGTQTLTNKNLTSGTNTFPTFNQSTTGNAATANALAATPTLCSTGNAPTGILANGNATGCAAISGGSSPLTTKGDLYGFSTTNARIPVGTNGQILIADSTQTLGLKWAAAGASNGFQTATFASPPTATGAGNTYYDTSTANPGLPLYYSTGAGTGNWLQWLVAGPSGGLVFSGNQADIDTNVVCRLTNSCPIAALWSFAIGQDFAEQASGSTPAAGKLHIYANTDHTFHQVTSGGVDTSLSGGGITTHYGLITNTATSQTIPGTSTATPITFDTNTDLTNSAIHSTVSNQQNFVADATGRWSGACQVTATNSTKTFSTIVLINGTPVFNNGGDSTPGAQNVPWAYALTSGDIVTCQVSSNVGFTVSSVGTTFYGFLIH